MKAALLTVLAFVGAALAACASPPPEVAVSPPLAASTPNVPATGTAAEPAEAASAGVPADATEATVTRVIDGDTVIVDFGTASESVRLIGIDTPEPRGGFQPAECFGDEASDFTGQLLPPGTTVLLTRDVEARDVYDRLLAYIYRAADGLFVNLAIVETGHATTLSIAPNTTFADSFAAAAATARSSDAGLWGACGGPDVPVSD